MLLVAFKAGERYGATQSFLAGLSKEDREEVLSNVTSYSESQNVGMMNDERLTALRTLLILNDIDSNSVENAKSRCINHLAEFYKDEHEIPDQYKKDHQRIKMQILQSAERIAALKNELMKSEQTTSR